MTTNLDIGLRDRLLSKIEVLDNGCWRYTGGINSGGYGNIWSEGTTRGAHVVSYEIHKGPVPKGKQVCHSCDYKPCINPEHLFAGTSFDNIHDMINKGRDGFKGTRNGRALLDEQQVAEIKRILNTGLYTQESIAADFNVCRGTISAINTGRNWGQL